MMLELSYNKRNFFDIVDKIIDNSKLSHAYLIELNNYNDDFDIILKFVKMILCNKTSNTLSNDNSNICKLVDDLAYPDLKIIEPDGQWIKKTQLLKLQEDFHNKSLLNNKRIYIIKEADKLNSSSANTMLKFLEEPESNVIAILLTKNRYHVIDTILSRCQILTIQDDIILDNISEETLELFEFILKSEELFINYNYIFNTLVKDKFEAKIRFFEIQYLFMRYINGENDFFSVKILNLLNKYDVDFCVKYVSIIEEEILKLEYNVNFKLWLDCLFARFIGGK